MKIPRDISGKIIINRLEKLGYKQTDNQAVILD